MKVLPPGDVRSVFETSDRPFCSAKISGRLFSSLQRDGTDLGSISGSEAWKALDEVGV